MIFRVFRKSFKKTHSIWHNETNNLFLPNKIFSLKNTRFRSHRITCNEKRFP